MEKLASEGKLEILYYPEKGTYFPKDDEDLVMKATLSYQQSGEKIFKLLEEYQPGLLSRVNQAIEEKRYADYKNLPTPRGA